MCVMLTACATSDPALAPPSRGGGDYPDLVTFSVTDATIRAPWSLNAFGEVMVDGDMVIGPLDDVFPPADPLASNRDLVFPPFPNNKILYAFDTDLTAEQQLIAKDALNTVSLYTPVRFERIGDGSTNFGGIRFRSGDPTSQAALPGWATGGRLRLPGSR